MKRKPEVYKNEIIVRQTKIIGQIDTLPAGFGQAAQALNEPIPIEKIVYVTEHLKNVLFSSEMLPESKRNCRTCDSILPPNRHWHCHKCKPLEADMGDYVYCEVSGE